ncbi:bifunctional lysine ketoglutarate reductase /saccharopine dehydrogenase family protein [Candidatus Zixiibacteriota bacterium]
MADQLKKIGIRREDKSEWERRVPLIPDDVALLKEKSGIQTVIQPSKIRIFPDDEYRRAGALVEEDLSGCPVVFAVKEIPLNFIQPAKTFMFFSHTIKGQPYNMPLLRRLMEHKCQLIDYERVVDEQNQRLIFFGRHAGMAGMTDTLWSLGQRLKIEGISSPFAKMKPAHQYDSVEQIKAAVAEIGQRIATEGVPTELAPLVIGFAGYGNVSQGAQSIIESLPLIEITAAELADGGTAVLDDPKKVYKVVFAEKDMVVPRAEGMAFELQDYYQHPEKYRSRFDDYTPHLSVLVNCIFWDTPYPRLVTKEFLKRLFAPSQAPRLKVIGDISCDVEGSIEATLKATLPDNPVFVYDPVADRALDGFAGRGPVIMAVDILPSELPRLASQDFSTILRDFVPEIAAADYAGGFDDCRLPASIKRAVILYHGELTPDYRFMEKFV